MDIKNPEKPPEIRHKKFTVHIFFPEGEEEGVDEFVDKIYDVLVNCGPYIDWRTDNNAAVRVVGWDAIRSLCAAYELSEDAANAFQNVLRCREDDAADDAADYAAVEGGSVFPPEGFQEGELVGWVGVRGPPR